MVGTTLLDTGPLVAALSRRDVHHEWASAQMAQLAAGVTCEAVLTEASYLLARDGAADAVIDFILRTGTRVEPVLDTRADRVAALMRKYSDVPMSLAEDTKEGAVFTVDSDFTVYRTHGRRRIPLLAPFR